MTVLWCPINILCVVVLLIHVSAREHGFLSIDCGSQDAYTDATTGIQWVTDHQYIRTGSDLQLPLTTSSSELGKKNFSRAMRSARYFPARKPAKNCYVLPAQEGQVYLIRAMFQQLVGSLVHVQNSSNDLRFDLSVDSNLWLTVHSVNASSNPITHEAIFTAQSHEIHFCLINIGEGDPFISSLELRPLQGTSYGQLANGSFLSLLSRIYCGGDETKGLLRYPDDRFDRIWRRPNYNSNKNVNTSQQVSRGLSPDVPTSVMQTAWFSERAPSFMHVSKSNSRETTGFLSILYQWDMRSENLGYHENTTKHLNQTQERVIPEHKRTSDPDATFWDIRPMGSKAESTREIQSLSPVGPSGSFLNAAEFYAISPSASRTHDNDVTAISRLQRSLNLSDVWTGDPCLPIPWDWIVCDSSDPPRITQVLLNSTDFVGAIPDFSGLEKLQYIHVRNEDLSGEVSDVSSKRRILRIMVQCHTNVRGSNRTGCTAIKSSSIDDVPQRKQAQWKRVLNSTAFIAVASVLAYLVLIGIIIMIVVQTRRDLCPADVLEEGEPSEPRTVVDAETGRHPSTTVISPPPPSSTTSTNPPPPHHHDQITRESENIDYATSRTDLIAQGGLRSHD